MFESFIDILVRNYSVDKRISEEYTSYYVEGKIGASWKDIDLVIWDDGTMQGYSTEYGVLNALTDDEISYFVDRLKHYNKF